MKQISLYKLALIILTAVLAGCVSNPTLPEKTANTNLGILAIPKTTTGDAGVPMHLNSYATELQVKKRGSDTVLTTITVDRGAGSSFKFVDTLEVGDYIVSGISTVPVNRITAVSTKGTVQPVKIRFSIKPGVVTVFPFQIVTKKRKISIDRFTSRLRLVSTEDDLDTLKALLQKSKNLDQWEVKWL